MPYGRKRNYKGRRRYYRRRSLRTSNVLLKTSAKSQARQINALNKKVNRINYLVRPEIQISRDIPFEGSVPFVYDTADPKSIEPKFFTASPFSRISVVLTRANTVKLRTFNLNLQLNYGDNYLQNSGKDASRSFGVRFVLVQLLTPANPPPQPAEIMEYSASDPDWNGVRALRDGITATVRVLSDWRYNLTDQRPAISRRLFFNRLNNIIYNKGDETDTLPAGAIVLYVFPFGWKSVEGFEQQIRIHASYKFAYTGSVDPVDPTV